MSRFMFIESNFEKTWMHNVRILESNVEAVVLYNQHLCWFCFLDSTDTILESTVLTYESNNDPRKA